MPLRPFIIDCDTGRDDAITLWLAALAELPLVGVVASYGNTSLEGVADNTARVLSLVGRDDIPLLVGLEKPQRDHKLYHSVVVPRQESSGNGLCNLEFPPSTRAAVPPSSPQDMALALQKLAHIHGALDYFIIGPASNFAATALALGEALKDTIARVTMLGGKLDSLWTEMPGADFNIASDPFAGDTVMRLGLPMRFVPLNATWPINMALPAIEALSPTTSLAKWAQDLMIAHCRHFAPEPIFRFHDPSVMLAAKMPEHFVERRLALVRDEASAEFGRLIERPEGVVCQVYRTDKATQDIIQQSILRWLGFVNI